MQIFGFLIGLITFLVYFIASIPLLGWLNWFNIPMAALGLALSVSGVISARRGKTLGIIGAIMCSIAIFFGLARLVVGCGII
ncbi:MAG: hypothetical protein V1894_01325 [Chloroflexota bacterium]